ncbi:MAG: DUF115 domain-containing protein [Treponema sp.]|jgi:hypothetical protein|nr:DUF115 domain-containing protein [Treponema sp.]
MPPGSSNNLHSRYNPRGEAERYVNSLTLKEGIRFFILIEPGLGYLVPPLRKKNPAAKVIALHCARPGAPGEGENSPDSSWHPESGLALQDFLEKEIPDTKAGTVKIIEWRPGLGVFGEQYLRLMEETVEFIKRVDASARTAGEFGRRWLGNFFRNLGLLGEILAPSPLSLPVVVAGAGPGLEDAIPLLKERQGSLFILAVSSATAALEERGLTPDLVIATDGGNWARLHLAECWRRIFLGKKACAGLAAALVAALPSQCASVPILPISDGSRWQNLVLAGLGIPSAALPQRGTVAASALDLAFYLTRGKVFITGLDLALRDIRSHVRPYGFDALWEKNEGRLNPVYSQSFVRAAGARAGGSYGIYASWFGRRLEAWPRRLFTLGKNNPVFEALGTSDPGNGFSGNDPGPRQAPFRTLLLKKHQNPSRKAALLIRAALQDPRRSGETAGELGCLLFPGREPVPLRELEEAVLSLACPPRRHE